MSESRSIEDWSAAIIKLENEITALKLENAALRAEVNRQPTREWYEKRCRWYQQRRDECDALLDVARAASVVENVLRSYADATMTSCVKDVPDAKALNLANALRDALAHPFVQEKLKEAPDAP